MEAYELKARAELCALIADESGFTNTRDALLEIARLIPQNDNAAPSNSVNEAHLLEERPEKHILHNMQTR
ncbi:MAG: hypothetical protein AB8C02_14665 [Halioglobus sp.]